MSGPIDFKWGGDWYAEEATILYEPQTAASGNLTLENVFEDL